MLFPNSCSPDWRHCTSLLCWTKQLPWLELLLSSEHLWEKCSGIEELHLQKPHYCCYKGLLPPEETQILNTCPVPGWAGAPRVILLGFGAVLGHGWVYSPVWEIVDELAEGLASLSHSSKEHPEPPSSPLLFPAAGNHGAPVPCCLSGKERSCWCGWGMEAAVELFVCRVGFATTMGQVPRVVPGYLELSF